MSERGRETGPRQQRFPDIEDSVKPSHYTQEVSPLTPEQKSANLARARRRAHTFQPQADHAPATEPDKIKVIHFEFATPMAVPYERGHYLGQLCNHGGIGFNREDVEKLKKRSLIPPLHMKLSEYIYHGKNPLVLATGLTPTQMKYFRTPGIDFKKVQEELIGTERAIISVTAGAHFLTWTDYERSRTIPLPKQPLTIPTR